MSDVKFTTVSGIPGALAKVYSAALSRETLHEMLAELVAHGRVMITVVQPIYAVTSGPEIPSDVARVAVVKDYFAKPDETKP